MKITVWEIELYPVLIPHPAKPRKRRGVYEVDENIYKKWIKAYENFDNMQEEIRKMADEQRRKRRKSICGFKLGEIK